MADTKTKTKAKTKTKTIIIVEDNALNMKMFDDLLLNNGYETIPMGDGSTLIETARERHPDLIIMDIQLPDRSGLELTRLLKDDRQLKTIPVIAVTAFAMPADRARILKFGCDDYISKPISPVGFLKAIAKHLA